MATDDVPYSTVFPTSGDPAGEPREKAAPAAARPESAETPEEANQVGPTSNTRWHEEAKPETEKLKHKYNQLINDWGTHYATVYFTNGSVDYAKKFEDIERICQMMDEESAVRFRHDVSELQAEGKLLELLHPNMKKNLDEQAREHRKQQNVRVQEYDREVGEFNKAVLHKEVKSLNNQTMAQVVTVFAVEGLSNPELNPLFREMENRGQMILICVLDMNTREMISETPIEPQNLIVPDTSKDKTELEEWEHKLAEKRKSLFR